MEREKDSPTVFDLPQNIPSADDVAATLALQIVYSVIVTSVLRFSSQALNIKKNILGRSSSCLFKFISQLSVPPVLQKTFLRSKSFSTLLAECL